MSEKGFIAERLYQVYRDSRIGSRREAEAIAALGECGGSTAVGYLEFIYKNTPSGSDRESAAIRALGRAGRNDLETRTG
ncbi:hypothetical protein J4447_05055 [Candidatus Pacearchaeota archaeon]|nr:hypothetical protein [Candidatus Aenigmarchaeota archaeon]MBS3074788.1 hypothetical protein [Candidatus Pacearchaeota archaeon]